MRRWFLLVLFFLCLASFDCEQADAQEPMDCMAVSTVTTTVTTHQTAMRVRPLVRTVRAARCAAVRVVKIGTAPVRLLFVCR